MEDVMASHDPTDATRINNSDNESNDEDAPSPEGVTMPSTSDATAVRPQISLLTLTYYIHIYYM